MKKLRMALMVIAVVTILISACMIPAFATATVCSEDIIYFEDGSYLVVELITCENVARVSNTISGQKRATYSNSSGETMWVFSVHGDFTYNGTSATATNASYSYTIYNDAWTFKKGEASCSGNQAIAEATFNGGFLINRRATVTLTCAPDGTLS